MAHKEIGFNLFEKLKQLLAEDVKIEKQPSMEGKQIIMIISENS